MYVPPRPESVRDVAYVVQPGDDVGHIAQKVTGDWRRWPELVGANIGKGTVGAPGVPYRVFRSLAPGEHLRVPSSWPGPGSVGQVPPELAAINLGVNTVYQGILGALQGSSNPIPSGNVPTATQVADIIYSWWPYIEEKVEIQTGPKPPLDLTTLSQWASIIQGSIKNALMFIRDTGVKPEVASNVPWDQLPQNFPWGSINDLANLAGVTANQLWTFLQQSFAMQFDPSRIPGGYMRPSGTFMGPSAGMVGQTIPDFLGGTNWASPPWNQIPYDVVTKLPPDFMAQLGNAAVQACLQDVTQTKVARLKQMIACKQCYTGKGAAVFVEGICGTSDPCACTAAPLPPPPTPPEPPVDEAEVEGEKADIEEPKKDNTLYWVLGIGAAAVVGWFVIKE